MIRLLLFLLSAFFIVLGLLAILSPIPVGLILIGLGLSILLSVSHRARTLLQNGRAKYEGLNARLHSLEAFLEKRFTNISANLAKTRPTSRKLDD